MPPTRRCVTTVFCVNANGRIPPLPGPRSPSRALATCGARAAGTLTDEACPVLAVNDDLHRRSFRTQPAMRFLVVATFRSIVGKRLISERWDQYLDTARLPAVNATEAIHGATEEEQNDLTPRAI